MHETPGLDCPGTGARTALTGRAPKTADMVKVKPETWTGRQEETRPSTRSWTKASATCFANKVNSC